MANLVAFPYIKPSLAQVRRAGEKTGFQIHGDELTTGGASLILLAMAYAERQVIWGSKE